MKRVAITGSSGYLGRRLVARLREHGVTVLGIDHRAPREGEAAPDEFAKLDIFDRELAAVLEGFAPDTIVHGAFAVEPMRDLAEMQRIDLDGSLNVLHAAETAKPERLMFVSSATVYGAWPDNPVPMDEDQPLRAGENFPYAAHKRKVEELFVDFGERFPETTVSQVRPAIVGRRDRGNYLHRFIFGMRFLVNLDGQDQPLQFVHGDDVVRAIHAILSSGKSGPFNVAPRDAVMVSAIAQRTERWILSVPLEFARGVYQLGWSLRFPWPKTPPGFLSFARYPWVVRSKRLEDELGFEFRHSTEAVLQEILAAERDS